jgi:hypothetical protein
MSGILGALTEAAEIAEQTGIPFGEALDAQRRLADKRQWEDSIPTAEIIQLFPRA